MGATIDIKSAMDKTQTSMRQAFVFITAEPDSSKGAIEDLKKVEGVVELYNSGGAYDIIAKVNGESLEHLRDIILNRLRIFTTSSQL